MHLQLWLTKVASDNSLHNSSLASGPITLIAIDSPLFVYRKFFQGHFICTPKDKIKENKVRWCQYLNGMPEDRLPVNANKYRPTGNRDLGRPKKRWVTVQAEEPNPLRGEEEESFSNKHK
jgi:hypothetical protein